MADVAFASNNLATSDLFRSPHESNIPTNNNGIHAMPGSWFFETDSSSGSGGSELSPDYNDDFQLNSLRASLSCRNVTEPVEVPSSEHVAEIVGRQGCKIKALRAKTNTYIKTPVRGDEPVFVVTGKHEDVLDAKREIECAAEHFTQIRASRRLSQGQTGAAPGHVTAYVRVPLRVVGLVVGPKGATIKRIQQDTHTYIVTPSRCTCNAYQSHCERTRESRDMYGKGHPHCKEPIFEVTGLPQNVDAARREIEQHIYQRTGSIPITDQNITSISNFDLKAVASAATIANASIQNRPNYGALATGTHEMRRKTAWKAIMQAQEMIKQGHASGDFQSVAQGTLAYNNALKEYHSATSAQQAAAKQLGVLQVASGNQAEYVQSTYASEFSVSNRASPISLNGQHLGAIGTQQRAISPQQQLYGQLESNNFNAMGAASAPKNAMLCADDSADSEPKILTLNALIGMFGEYCGMGSAANSGHSSCDEGLGESPTSSINHLAPPTSDPYHLMISSIWSDLDTSASQLDKTLQPSSVGV